MHAAIVRYYLRQGQRFPLIILEMQMHVHTLVYPMLFRLWVTDTLSKNSF